MSLCSLQGSFQPVCYGDHLFSDAKFRAHIMSSDDCLVTSIYDESCIKVYLYCICVSPIDIFALAIPRSLGVAEAPVCRGIKATWPVESKAHHPFWGTLMLTHHEVIIEIHCIEYIPTCLALNRHLPNENVESKNITQPETHLYGVESGPGPGISFNDSGRLRIQFNLGCLNTFWFYLCIALTPMPGICSKPVAIWGFSLICVILCLCSDDMHMCCFFETCKLGADFCILYLSLYQSRVLRGTWHAPGFVGDSQLLPSMYRILLSHTNTRNHELEIIRIYISGDCNI